MTTVVIGNCSLGLAPAHKEDRETLASILSHVEAIPLEAIRAGVTWDWETIPQYLDALDRRLGINVACLIGHSAVRRYVRDAGPLLEDLNELVRSDVTTRNAKRARAISNRIDELEQRIVELGQREELDAMRPPIDGNQVMEYLGLEPGPRIGEIMDMLLERRIDDGPYSEEEAFALLDSWVGEGSGS